MSNFEAAADMRRKARNREDRIIDGIDRNREEHQAIPRKKEFISRGILHPDCAIPNDWRFDKAVRESVEREEFLCYDCYITNCPANGTNRPWREEEEKRALGEKMKARVQGKKATRAAPTQPRETTKQIAERMGISAREVRRLRREGKLPPAE